MKLTFHKYRLPFITPLQTSQQAFNYREGIILICKSAQTNFIGEAAPLPEYSVENIGELEKSIEKSQKTIAEALQHEDSISACAAIYDELHLPPSLQFGLDSLAYQLQAFQEKRSLPKYLFNESGFCDKIPVNALQSLHSKNVITEIEKRVVEGFQTIKFKVGIDFDKELRQLKRIRDQFPDLTLRLDANQAWSTDQATQYCSELESLDIEYCEEPLKDPRPVNFEHLAQKTGLPLALDESIIQTSYWPNLLPFSSFVVLKPMLLGNFSTIFETKRLADTHNNKAVFTTSLESGVGRIITAVLASGLGTQQTAHGLHTGNLFTEDVLPDLTYISSGKYQLELVSFPLALESSKLNALSTSLF